MYHPRLKGKHYDMGKHYGDLLYKTGEDLSSAIKLSDKQKSFGQRCLPMPLGTGNIGTIYVFTKDRLLSYNIAKYERRFIFMNNYEIMMNGNVKIGEYAPDFEAITTMGNIKFSDYRGKWVVLFSHPGDFTPV